MKALRFNLNIIAVSWVAALVGAATATHAAEEIGKAVAVIDHATTEGSVGKRTLSVGAKIHRGERVRTDSIGEAQILFDDGTRMVLGPNSDMMLDDFVFRSGDAENQFVVRAFNGAFRFITGNASKDAYLIHTPAATIGVRGTVFDFAVTPGDTNLLLLHGGVNVCGNEFGCTRATVD
jgi:hypothetical protein